MAGTDVGVQGVDLLGELVLERRVRCGDLPEILMNQGTRFHQNPSSGARPLPPNAANTRSIVNASGNQVAD